MCKYATESVSGNGLTCRKESGTINYSARMVDGYSIFQGEYWLLAAPEKEFLKKGKGFPSNNWFAEPDNWWTIDLVPEWRKCPDQRLFRMEWSFAKG